MTLKEIMQAVDDGKKVKWKNNNYLVEKWRGQGYMIVCQSNRHATGLTWVDNVTMNEKPEDFKVI